MKPKLSYDEFKKAVDAGAIVGHACACMGPQDGNEFCPCSMNMLDLLTPEGRQKLASEWSEKKEIRQKKYEESLKTQHEKVRERRLARMKELQELG